ESCTLTKQLRRNVTWRREECLIPQTQNVLLSLSLSLSFSLCHCLCLLCFSSCHLFCLLLSINVSTFQFFSPSFRLLLFYQCVYLSIFFSTSHSYYAVLIFLHSLSVSLSLSLSFSVCLSLSLSLSVCLSLCV